MKRRRRLLGKKDSTLTVELYQGPCKSINNKFPSKAATLLRSDFQQISHVFKERKITYV